jgi:hypothetical protein
MKWRWGRFVSEQFDFPLSVQLYESSKLFLTEKWTNLWDLPTKLIYRKSRGTEEYFLSLDITPLSSWHKTDYLYSKCHPPVWLSPLPWRRLHGQHGHGGSRG